MDYSRPHSLEVPDSDIGYHFGTLLDSQEGADVIFSVAGQKFHAHKLVLAARSSFFRSEFFDPESDEEKNESDTSDEIREIVIDDMEPKVFEVCFYYANLILWISLFNILRNLHLSYVNTTFVVGCASFYVQGQSC
jgi:speckle-type POZ protein